MDDAILLFQQTADFPRIDRNVLQILQRHPDKVQIHPHVVQLVITGNLPLTKEAVILQMDGVIEMAFDPM